jgi:hypothetical protein
MPAIEPDFARLRWAGWQARLQSWTREFPSLVRLGTLGKTRQGQKIPLVIIGSPIIGGGGGAEVMLLTGIHPREQSPPLVVAAWLEGMLRENHPLLRERTIFWVPFLNLDGKIHDDEGGALGRDLRKNAAGVDLNRNFAVRWGGGRAFDPAWSGSTDDPKTNIYEGPAPLSEPETQALEKFWATHPNLRAFLDVHNPLRELLCPAYVPASDQPHFIRMLETMSSRQKTPYPITKLVPGAEPKPGMRAGNSGLSYTHAYYLHGIFGFNLELSTPGKERGRAGRYPSPDEIRAEYEPNLKGPLDAFLEQASTLPLPQKGSLKVRTSPQPLSRALAGSLGKGLIVEAGWLPPQIDGPCERAVLISESKDLVVTSEYRSWPVQTPFTIELQPSARPGQKHPMALYLWDAQRRRTVHRFHKPGR